MSLDFSRLTNLSFDEAGKSFIKSDDENRFKITVPYVPIDTSSWTSDYFELHFFENAYLNAENDVYEVYATCLKERLGWIFPLTILESNNNDYKQHKNLNDYKYVAYRKLLELKLTYTGDDYKEQYLISDFYPDCSICLISKATTDKIPNFNINDYLLSFFDYGYVVYDLSQGPKAIPTFDRSKFVNKVRSDGGRKIRIRAAGFSITSNEFTKSLFCNHLLQSDNYLIRFIFLYQIIEYLMHDEFDTAFKQHVQNFSAGKLGKNDLKELLINASRERNSIRRIIENCGDFSIVGTEFIHECTLLFELLNRSFDTRTTLSDAIYNLRNLITHQLRDLTAYEKQVTTVVQHFERVIVTALINYQETARNV